MSVLVNIDRGARWPRALWAGRTPKTNRQSESELPFVTLPGSWDDYLAARSANFRQQIRRRERKLAKLGDLRLRSASAESLEADMATLFRLHLLRWEGRGRSALADPAAQDFLRRFARAAQERGWLRLHTLELDGEPIAAFFGWRLGARYAFYQSGFDPAHADHSVGSVILAMTIRSAIEEGAHEFDMLLGTEPYKRRFTDRARPVETVVVAGARSARGLLLTGEAAARRRGRELARRPRLEAAVRKVAGRMPSAWRS
jgi:CelD/BcsL family acetyltransferase involved in cellulose biosynthesis